METLWWFQNTPRTQSETLEWKQTTAINKSECVRIKGQSVNADNICTVNPPGTGRSLQYNGAALVTLSRPRKLIGILSRTSVDTDNPADYYTNIHSHLEFIRESVHILQEWMVHLIGANGLMYQISGCRWSTKVWSFGDIKWLRGRITEK